MDNLVQQNLSVKLKHTGHVKKNLRMRIQRIAHWTFILFRGIILAGVSYYILYPLIAKFMLAIMDRTNLYDITVGMIPHDFTLENIQKVWKALDYPNAFANTLFVTLVTTVTQVISCTLVGYGFARFNFPFKRLLFGLVLFSLIIPPATIIIPMYLNYRFFDFTGGLLNMVTGFNINLVGSPWTFIISGITCMGFKNGLYIYLVRQYYRNVPKELEEAAMIDGAGFFKTFLVIMLPSAKPILSIIVMFSAVWQWTDIFYSSWFMKDAMLLSRRLDVLAMNISVQESINGVANLDLNYITQLNATGGILVILPLIVLYIFGQKLFVEGIERSGIVG